MTENRFPFCNRGIFGLKSWEPLRKPGCRAPLPESFNNKTQQQQQQQQQQPVKSQSPQPQGVVSGAGDTRKDSKSSNYGKRLLAKFSYDANVTSPLGDELNMKQGDHLTLHSDSHHLWWLAEDASGKVGYAPASYLMIVEEKAGGLPWLNNRKVDEIVEAAPMKMAFGIPDNADVKVKPYQSAYNRGSNDNQLYYCKVCDKQLNGPQPYKSHMASRNHREEVEDQGR